MSRIRAAKGKRKRRRKEEGEREKNRRIERGKETARCATRRAINVNHLADAQFNKGHYDRELEVTSTRRDLSLSLVYL